MGRLIYHNQSGLPGQYSPFDEAILEVAQTGSVSIVSPYIGVDYLQRIIQLSPDWRLISDIEAWLSSLSIRARPKAWAFIRENLDSIHHCPSIHAKAVMSKHLAMFGSANLTHTGILGRTELGMLIDEPHLVEEMGIWFEGLWQQTHPPIADETNAFVQWLDDVSDRTPSKREKFSLSASGKKIRASLVQLPVFQRQTHKSAPLNLDEVAQSIVLQEFKHYESLEEAIEEAINILVKNEFSFKQIQNIVQGSFESASRREIYFVLLQHCANHVRSAFAINTRNRLIVRNGGFKQSTQELILEALVPFDFFLTWIVRHFDFENALDLVDEIDLKQRTGFNGEEQIILISELIDCGFLEIKDIAGNLAQYKLIEDFEWEGRFKLFKNAMHDWDAKVSHYRKKPKLSRKTDEVITEDDEDSEFETSYRKEKQKSIETMIESQAIRSFFEHASKGLDQRQTAQAYKRQREVDKIMSIVLTRLLSGEKLEVTKDLLTQLSQRTGVSKILIDSVLSSEGVNIKSVILFEGDSMTIHPDLNWESLTNYPLTQQICKDFLSL